MMRLLSVLLLFACCFVDTYAQERVYIRAGAFDQPNKLSGHHWRSPLESPPSGGWLALGLAKQVAILTPTGGFRAKVEIESEATGLKAIDDKQLLCGTYSGRLHLIDVVKRAVLWSKDPGVGEVISSIAVLKDGKVVVAGTRGAKLLSKTGDPIGELLPSKGSIMRWNRSGLSVPLMAVDSGGKNVALADESVVVWAKIGRSGIDVKRAKRLELKSKKGTPVQLHYLATLGKATVAFGAADSRNQVIKLGPRPKPLTTLRVHGTSGARMIGGQIVMLFASSAAVLSKSFKLKSKEPLATGCYYGIAESGGKALILGPKHLLRVDPKTGKDLVTESMIDPGEKLNGGLSWKGDEVTYSVYVREDTDVTFLRRSYVPSTGERKTLSRRTVRLAGKISGVRIAGDRALVFRRGDLSVIVELETGKQRDAPSGARHLLADGSVLAQSGKQWLHIDAAGKQLSSWDVRDVRRRGDKTIVLAHDGKLVRCLAADGSELWSLALKREGRNLRVSADGKRCVVGGYPPVLIDSEKGTHVAELSGGGVSFSPCQRYIAIATGSGKRAPWLTLVNPVDGKRVAHFLLHERPGYSSYWLGAVSPDTESLLIGSSYSSRPTLLMTFKHDPSISVKEHVTTYADRIVLSLGFGPAHTMKHLETWVTKASPAVQQRYARRKKIGSFGGKIPQEANKALFAFFNEAGKVMGLIAKGPYTKDRDEGRRKREMQGTLDGLRGHVRRVKDNGGKAELVDLMKKEIDDLAKEVK